MSSRALPLLTTLAILALIPAIAGEFHLLLLTKILALALFAMSLDLLVGHAGLISFGHAAYLGAGAYTAALLAPESLPANLLLTLPAAMVSAGLLALVIGALCVRATGVYFIMATLAFAQMAYFAVHDSPWFGGSDGVLIFSRPVIALGDRVIADLSHPVAYYYTVVVALMAGYLVLSRLVRSPFGQVIRGIRINEARTQALGWGTYGYKLTAFVIAGGLAGLAGYLLAYQAEYVSPALMDWRQSGLVLMMVILGGRGTLIGPAVGALAIVILEEVLAELTVHWMLPMGLFIIAAVILLPRGIAGLLDREREAIDG